MERNLLVANDRIISKFPVAPIPDATPYKEADFHPLVYTASAGRGSSSAGRCTTCKCVVVGEVAVGKTSLVNRFCHKSFERDYKATIGVDFEVEKLAILGMPFRLQIWDTAGQERFRSIGSAYYRGAQAVVAAFDLTDLSSLDKAVQWMEDACQGGSRQPTKFLVGTKRDALGDTKYKTAAATAGAVCDRLGAEYWPTSALTGDNVHELFFRVAALSFQSAVLEELAEMREGDRQEMASSIQVGSTTPGAGRSRASCCS